jgi:hypothetical protein
VLCAIRNSWGGRLDDECDTLDFKMVSQKTTHFQTIKVCYDCEARDVELKEYSIGRTEKSFNECFLICDDCIKKREKNKECSHNETHNFEYGATVCKNCQKVLIPYEL